MDWDDIEERDRTEKEAAIELELRLRAAVRLLGKNYEGQEFLRWMLAECGVFQQDFPRDEKAAAWNAGRRAFGLQIFGLCAAEDMAGMLLTKEVIHE